MKKITQSALAVSLSATMLIQNMVVISHAEKINANKIEKNSTFCRILILITCLNTL